MDGHLHGRPGTHHRPNRRSTGTMTETSTETAPAARDIATEDQAEEVVLPGQHFRVYMDDGSRPIARVTNRERVLWDKTAPKHKWGQAQDVSSLSTTFCIW